MTATFHHSNVIPQLRRDGREIRADEVAKRYDVYIPKQF